MENHPAKRWAFPCWQNQDGKNDYETQKNDDEEEKQSTSGFCWRRAADFNTSSTTALRHQSQ